MQETISLTLLISAAMQDDSNCEKRKFNLADLLPPVFPELLVCQAVFPGSSSYPAEIITVCLFNLFSVYSDFHRSHGQ